MNILYDHQVFSWQRYGGISRYFYELIIRLLGISDARISLFLGFHKNEYGLEEYRDAFEFFCGMKRPSMPKTTKAFTRLNDILFNIIASTLRRDIYHQTYYTKLIPGFTGKRIVTVHDMIHEHYPEYFGSNDFVAQNKRESVMRADGVICISQFTKNDLLRHYKVPENKIKVVYHGNSLNAEVIAPPLIGTPYILYVGQRDGYKNFELLLGAYAHSRRVNSQYRLVCFGGDRISSQERQKIAALGLSNKVVHQSGNDEVLANIYRYASVLVYPSLYEGFGIPPLEAMHYGCPVLSSNSSSIPEVVGDAGLYFNPGDQDALLSGLEKILSDTLYRNTLIQRGIQQEKKFSWDVCAKETLAFYIQCATQ